MAAVAFFAFDTPPLVQPQPVHLQETYTVRVCLDDPLLGYPDVKKLAALCMAADTLLERAHRIPKAASSFDHKIIQEIELLCKQIGPRKHAQDTLRDLGMLELFPHLQQALTGASLEPVATVPGANYLTYISLLNQVVMLGTQLYHDAIVPSYHKYTAHQIALLYQCLNMLQGETKPIRRLVEARFDEVKYVTESRDPYMPNDLVEWLQEVTWLCREEVRSCPAYIHKRLQPFMAVVGHEEHRAS